MFKKIFNKKTAKKSALMLFVLLLLLPVVLFSGCTSDDPWTDDTYLQNLYVWDGATWNQITTNGGGGGGIGDVTAAANMADNTLIKGDGGLKGVQDSGITINDFDDLNTNGGDLTGFDINAGNDVNVTNDLDVTDDAGVGGNLTVTGSITSGGSAVILEGDARLTDARNPLSHSTSHESGGSDQVHSIADDDDDTKIQVEEAADEDKIRFDTGGTERSVLDSTGLTAPHSIADNYVVTVDQADAADNDFAKFTANGLEGRSYSETLSDIGAEAETHAADHAVSAADTVFPADPDADRYLMWDDNPGVLAWVAAVGGDVSTDAIWDAAGDLAVGTGANTAAKVNIGAEEVVARIGIANIDGISMAEQTVLARLTGASIDDVVIGIADNNMLQVDDATAVDNDYAKFTANGIEGVSYATVLSDIGAAAAADYIAKALMDADTVITATADNTPLATTMAEQTVLGRLTGGHPDDISIGVSDNYMVQIDSASVADDEYARFTANGLESRSYAEVLSDIGAAAAADYIAKALLDADTVITATADNTPLATTMAEQTVLGRLTGGHPDDVAIGIADNNIVQIDQADAADDEYARFTANGLESRSYAEVKSDLGLGSMAYETATNYVAKSLYDADSVVTATADDTPIVTTMAEQTVLGRLTGGHPDDIAIGITDDDILQADDATISDNDYAKFTANGVEGVTAGTVLSDIGAADTSHADTHESGGSDQVSNIADDDDDTKIQVEESADEDIIRFDTGGTERITVSSSGVDFKQYEAIAMLCDSGATLPAAPVAGQWFLHTPTGRKILYQYDGSSWITSSIISLGTVYLWVDHTGGGSNDADKGYGSGANAFDTVSYAISIIPPTFNGNVYIFVSGEAYAETVTIQGKTPGGNYTIYIYGTLSILQSGMADDDTTNNVVGSGAVYGILYQAAGGFTAAAHQNKLLLSATGTTTHSGVASSTVANQLVSAGENFSTSDIGKIVKNTTDTTYAVVTAYISATELLLNADIMANGENYEIYVTDGRIIDNTCWTLNYDTGYGAGLPAGGPAAGTIVKGAAGGRGIIVNVNVDGGTAWNDAAHKASGTIIVVPQNGTAFAHEDFNVYNLVSDNSTATGTFHSTDVGSADTTRLAIVGYFTATPSDKAYAICDWATSISSLLPQRGQLGIRTEYIKYNGTTSPIIKQEQFGYLTMVHCSYSVGAYWSSFCGSVVIGNSVFTSTYTSYVLKLETGAYVYMSRCKVYSNSPTRIITVELGSILAFDNHCIIDGTVSYGVEAKSGGQCIISTSLRIRNTTGAGLLADSFGGLLASTLSLVKFTGNTLDYAYISTLTYLRVLEQAAAPSTAATYGYSWWKNTTPNEPWITDDAGTSTSFPFVYSQSLVNDASITLRTGRAGFGTVIFGDNVERGEFFFTSAGVVTLGDISANVVNTDTVNKYCIIDAGSGPAIKNRSGGTLTVTAMVVYQ